MKMSGPSCHGGSARSGPFIFWPGCLRGKNIITVQLLQWIVEACLPKIFTLWNCLCRYGSPGNTTKEYTEFADLFLKEYAVPAQQVRTSHSVLSAAALQSVCFKNKSFFCFIHFPTRCFWKSYTSTRKSNMWLPEYSSRHWTTSTRA